MKINCNKSRFILFILSFLIFSFFNIQAFAQEKTKTLNVPIEVKVEIDKKSATLADTVTYTLTVNHDSTIKPEISGFHKIFKITKRVLKDLEDEFSDKSITESLKPIIDKSFSSNEDFLKNLPQKLTQEQKDTILKNSTFIKEVPEIRIMDITIEDPEKKGNRVIIKKNYDLQAEKTGSHTLPSLNVSYTDKTEKKQILKTDTIDINIKTVINIFSIFLAIAGGLLAFLSPCVLPLIPTYITFIAGTSAGSIAEQSEADKKAARRKTLINSILFIIGLSTVFITMGALASSIGQIMHNIIFKRVAGVVVILLGLHMTGIFQIKSLFMEKRFHFKTRPPGYIGSLLIGVAFAAGWTPCIGPLLGSILVLATAEQTVLSGMILLAVFSLGFGVPFFITALLIDSFFHYFKKVQKYMNLIGIISGILIIIVGILIFTDSLIKISSLGA